LRADHSPRAGMRLQAQVHTINQYVINKAIKETFFMQKRRLVIGLIMLAVALTAHFDVWTATRACLVT
jgi:hypothetical protein